MFRAALFWYIVLFWIGGLWGQALLEIELVDEIDLAKEIDYFKVDQFGQFYLIDGSDLTKISEQGKELEAFSKPSLGAISNLDVLSAMNPLLFYDDFNQILLLDNRLNEIRSINLLALGLTDPTLVAYTDENRVWLYDQVADRIILYNISLERQIGQSLNISQLTGSESKPIQLFSSFNHLVMRSQAGEILIFDAQASFRKKLSCSTEALVSFNNRYLNILEPNGLLREIDLSNDFAERKAYLANDGAQQLERLNQKIYTLQEQKIKVYQLL